MSSDRTHTEEVVRVHIENPDDLHTVQTQEKEPEHFTFTTITLTPGMSVQQRQVLSLDPLRKSASIVSNDAPAVLCDSPAQAGSGANQVAGFPDPDGGYLAQGQSASMNGTGPAWLAVQAATRVTVIINRRAV